MRRHLSYRCRRRLKRATLALLILGVVTAGVLLISFLYLERFVVYTEEGVILRRGDAAAAEENAPEPEPLPEVEIRTVYGGAKRPVREEETEAAEPEEFVPLQGYVVYYEDLKDPDTVLEKIQSDPDCTVVMLEVALGSGKSCFSGTFSGAGIAEELDAEATDALLRQLTGQYYLIAMLPAYQNTAYALANQSEGLMITGGALWVDWDGCYWMDPASEVSQKHLMDLCSELTEMGFDRVPVCIAKTQYSFSDNPSKLGAPEDFTVTVRNVKVSAGAGFIVVLTGDIMTMPGLPKVPAAEKIDVSDDGRITGLF